MDFKSLLSLRRPQVLYRMGLALIACALALMVRTAS
jgi:hypothetical protein